MQTASFHDSVFAYWELGRKEKTAARPMRVFCRVAIVDQREGGRWLHCLQEEGEGRYYAVRKLAFWEDEDKEDDDDDNEEEEEEEGP
jgi:hypothetical protein